MSEYMRCTQHSLKFTNKGKLAELLEFRKQYVSMVQKYINIYWNELVEDKNVYETVIGKNGIAYEKTKYKNTCRLLKSTISMFSSEDCNLIATETENDSRLRQCAAKQACSMVNAVVKKQTQRIYKLKQFQKENLELANLQAQGLKLDEKPKNTKYLQRKMNDVSFRKPNCENINIELDGRFVDIKQTPDKEFDMFVKISQIGNNRKICIPLNHTRVSNKWMKKGELRGSIRIMHNNSIVLFYKCQKPELTSKRKDTVGGDQGILNTLSVCVGKDQPQTDKSQQQTKPDIHGHTQQTIMNKLVKAKNGSKNYFSLKKQLKYYNNWALKQLDMSTWKQFNLERLCNVRKGKKNNGSYWLSHWTYCDIKNRLIMFSEEEGFGFAEVDNKFKSQRCSECGWTHKSNRKKKVFKCTNAACGFTTCSDLNAGSNNGVVLEDLNNYPVWKKHLNRTTGFYWLENCLMDQNRVILAPYVQKI